MNKAFTLIEVLVATLILSVTLIALASGEGVAVNASRRSILYTEASMLAANLMQEIDLMIEIEGFKYLEKIGKKKEANFEEEKYQNWKYIKEVKEVEIPVSSLLKVLLKDKEDNQNIGQEEIFVNLVANNIDKIMKQALREITVSVFWPVRGGKAFSSIDLVYYVVDYEEVAKFVPSL